MARLSVLFRHRRERVTGAGQLDFFLYRHLEPAGWVTFFRRNTRPEKNGRLDNELERKSPLLMGKSTIVTRTVVMFNSFLYVCLPVYQELQKKIRCLPGVSHDF